MATSHRSRQCSVCEGVANAPVQALGIVDDDQELRRMPEAACAEIVEHACDGSRILSLGLRHGQDTLVSLRGDSHAHNHLLLSQGLAIQEQRHELIRFKHALISGLQPPG